MLRHALLAVPALAALACLSGTASAQPVTGLYIGAGAGGNILQTERLTNPTGQELHYNVGEAGVASIGYGFGNGFRVELEGDIRHNTVRELAGTVFPSTSTGDRYTYGAMVNGLFDLDVRSPYVFPYLGVGAGYAWSQLDRFRTVGQRGAITTLNGTQGSFAYQGIVGASFPVPPIVGLSVTLEYRFLGTVGDRTYAGSEFVPGSNGLFPNYPSNVTLAVRSRYADAYNHSLLLGVRYAFNVPPPPLPPAQPAPAPVAQPTRTYLVFFDWDRADLTPRARQIIAEAAQASTRVQTTRVEVNGYTDLSGTARYNQGLSVRRAESVEAELVRDGVPRAEIAIRGFGESDPLVPTAQGVREPQNRRVEIILR
jgi:outer membrane protein OmpA-like peptidoglycan-associated protein